MVGSQESLGPTEAVLHKAAGVETEQLEGFQIGFNWPSM